MPIISLVAALARNRVIGAANRLPWHLPEDLRRFKRLTLGASIIMGRRTHEAIGKPLPGRRNIIVTRAPGASWDGCEVARSLDDAVRLARPAPEVFVIGGGELYGHALARADRLYLTLIDAEVRGRRLVSGVRCGRLARGRAGAWCGRERPAVRVRYLRTRAIRRIGARRPKLARRRDAKPESAALKVAAAQAPRRAAARYRILTSGSGNPLKHDAYAVVYAPALRM